MTLLILSNHTFLTAQENQNEKGIIGLMYHRFNENKYPTTNVRLKDFEEQLKMIQNQNIQFISIDEFKDIMLDKKSYSNKKVLLTIDDAYRSFYVNAWPILKEKKIPFILFLNTREINANNPNYMTWDQIREIKNSNIGTIGGHSFSHDYLALKTDKEIYEDIVHSNNDFFRELSYIPKYFSYPFGQYGANFSKIVKDLNYQLAFGQHSGVIDTSKNLFELPRYPINENYGKLDRFLFLLNTKPLPFKSFKPENKLLSKSDNPPIIEIEFFKNIKNINKIHCFSNNNRSGDFDEQKIIFIGENWIRVNLDQKFYRKTGRINCSIQDTEDKQWGFMGFQFTTFEE